MRRLLMIVVGWMALGTSGAVAQDTNPDTTPPLVISVVPAAATRNIGLNSTLQVAFSEPLDPTTVNVATIQLRDTRNVPVDGVVTYDRESRVATFVPAAPLLPTRTYTAIVAGGTFGTSITDAAGNPLQATYTWTFITTVEPARIAAGTTHSAAVDNSGQVWTWGGSAQQRGQALDGRIPGAVAGASGVVSIAAGNSHTIALKADGTLLAWGANSEGQLGINSQTGQSTPVAVNRLTGVIAIAAGAASSVALKADGTVWTWGSAHQIGDGQNMRRLSPVQVPSLTDVIAVAAGEVADYALKVDGTVWAWGDNTNGQIGDATGGSGTFRLTPVPVASLAGIVAIAGGSQHALAIVGSDLSVRAWGLNTTGQIGDGTTNTLRYAPTPVTGLIDVRSVDGAGNRSLAALLDGTVKAWGSAVTSTGTNSAVAMMAPGNPQGFQVTGNINHNLSVATNGTVWTWGLNASSQLGDGTAIDRRTADSVSGGSYSWKVGTPIFSVSAGTYSQIQNVLVTTATAGAVMHYTVDGTDPAESDPVVPSNGVVVVDRTVTLKAAGWKPGSTASSVVMASYSMQVAQPAFSPTAGTFTSPARVTITTATPGTVIHYTSDGSTPTAASPAYSSPVDVGTTVTLKAVGMRSGWSDSTVRSGVFTMNFGTLSAPTLTTTPGSYEEQVVVTLAAQELSTIRYTTNGSTPTATSTVYSGPLTLSATTTIKAKAFRTDYTTSAETSGTYTIVAVAPVISRASGTYAPGTNFTITDSDPAATIRITFNGVDPTSSDSAVPSGTTLLVGSFPVKARAFKTGSSSSAVAVANFALTEPFSAGAISAGGSHTLLATPGGLVYAWGLGTSGQLGLGGNTTRTTPAVVPTLTGVVSISGGAVHTLAATWDGRLFAWGSNASGRLGDGTTTTRLAPVEITSLQHVVAVAAGGSHSLALTADGHVYAWGVGSSGQLGLGATNSVLTPTLIPTLSDVAAIAAGGSHSLAVTVAGNLYAWGLNTSSQLGDGGQATQTRPKLITSLFGVNAVSAGATHSLARLRDSTVYSWGDNSSGQLGVGDTVIRRVPTPVPGLSAVDVIAGGSHSIAVTTDGVLVAWGANSSGQLGDTTTSAPRPSAVAVSGPAQVAAIAAGSAHSVAVTSNGHVWTWGSDGLGQLGDGVVTTSRPTPLDVLTTSDTWGGTSPPILSVVPGTYSAPQTLIVSNGPGGAAEMHYTTTGENPTEADALIADGASLVIDRNVTLKLRAWSPGRLPSAVVTASYVLTPDPPAVAPGSGTYTSTQDVTITSSTAGAVIRYSVDGTEPNPSSPVYSGTIGINTFTILKAKTFREGWTPSSTAIKTFSFNYGTLPTPTIAPAGGRYTPGQTVAINVGPGEQARYTLDGTDPDQTSAPYASPIPLSSGSVTVKARAFKIDWTASPVSSESYTVTDDTTPPTITASFSTSPNAAGWYAGDVTVTFTCTDASQVTACTSPITVHSEGPDIPVTGGATDEWGNHASVTVTANIDRTAPTLNVYTSFAGVAVKVGTESVTLRGGVHDLSGIEAVSCGGVPATVMNGLFTCVVSVTDGVNVIAVEARDLVGHSATRTVSFFAGNEPDATSISVSPATTTMFAGDSRELFLKDNWGRPAAGEWSVDNSYVAQIAQQDGIITLTAISAGEAVLTVHSGTLTAEAAVTVLVAGGEIQSGTTLWTLSDTSGFGVPKRAEVLRASSLDPSGDPRTDPALFFIDEGTEWTGGVLDRWWNRPTRIRATTADGRELWDRGWTDRQVQQVAADNNGGIVVVLASQDFEPQVVRRIDGRTGEITWEYIASEGGWTTHVSDVAIHPDGTVFLVQTGPSAAHLVGIGPTGISSRWLLPGGHFTQVDVGECVQDVDKENPAHATYPIVREDGAVVMVANAQTTSARIRTYRQGSQCMYNSAEAQRLVSQTYYLLELVPGAGLTASEINPNGVWTTSEDANLEANRLLPDGHGGLLLVSIPRTGWVKPSIVARVDANKQVVWEKEIYNPNATDQHYETEYVLGEDGVYELINSVIPNRPEGTPKYYSTVVQFDSATGAVLNHAQLGAPTTEPEHTRLKFALAGGGVYANGPSSAYTVNTTTIGASGFAVGGNASPLGEESWVGFSPVPAIAIGSPVLLGNTSWPVTQGTLLAADNASSNPYVGVFAKSHPVAGIGHHVSIRLVPRTSAVWHARYPQIFQNKDPQGNWFATLGAGPLAPNDSTIDCDSYPLVSKVNRERDVDAPPTALERLRYDPAKEDELISMLLQLDANYLDDLRYCWHPNGYTTFNSNSYSAGLLHAASVPLPLFPSTTLFFHVGWTEPVPVSKFRSH